MGERLRNFGNQLAEARSTALFHLATELPAAVFARTLGIDITAAVAVRWQRAAAKDWAAYAAEISERATRRQQGERYVPLDERDRHHVGVTGTAPR